MLPHERVGSSVVADTIRRLWDNIDYLDLFQKPFHWLPIVQRYEVVMDKLLRLGAITGKCH